MLASMIKRSASNDNDSPLSASARDWKEGRRLRALELLSQGYRASTVARILGVSPGAVSQWTKRARQGGAEALFRRRRCGRVARLRPDQLLELKALLATGGEAISARDAAAIIVREWGITYSRAHVSRMLKAMGLGAPPKRRALPLHPRPRVGVE